MKNIQEKLSCDFNQQNQILNIKIDLKVDPNEGIDVYNQVEDQGQILNFKEFLYRILNYWYWFVFCGILGLIFTLLYNRNIVPIWQVDATIIVNEGSKITGLNNLFSSLDLGASANMQNHIELLKSYSLNRQTIENLNWRTSWFEKGQFIDNEFYKNEPYIVREPDGWVNPTDIPILVKVLSDDQFQISCIFDEKINGEIIKIDFTQNGKLDVPIVTPYFCFTLTKGPGYVKSGTICIFKFNDTNKMTLSYCGKSKKMTVGLTEKTAEILKISVNGSQPAREVDYINELLGVFILYGLNEKNRTADNTVGFIETQLVGIADSLRDAGQSFTSFRTNNQILDLSKEGAIILSKLNDLESQKANADMKLIYFGNLKNYISSAATMKQAISPSVIGIDDDALGSMIMKLASLYSRRETLAFSVQNENPAVILLDREIQSTREILKVNLTNLEQNTQTSLDNIKSRIIEVFTLLEKLPKTEQEFINYKRRYDINNQLYTLLLTKRAEAAIIKASNVADSRVIDKARLETALIIGPNKVRNLLIGLLLGLFTPLLIIIIGDYFNDTIKDKEQIKRATSIPIIGEIGFNQYEDEFVTIGHPRSEIAESFRGLRTNLQFILNDNIHNVVGIHSTIPGEGKSFTSLNLATIIAMNDKKVLLVATDMRKPRLNLIFHDEHASSGLSTYLIERDSFQDIICSTKIQNLSFVASGPIPPNPSELLENKRFKEFIDKAKSIFDYVIIDNAPVPVVTDGFITSQLCDANLFIVRQGYSHYKQLKYINDLSINQTMPQINLILNGITNNGHNYKYGNSYRNKHNGYYDDLKRTSRWENIAQKIFNLSKKA